MNLIEPVMNGYLTIFKKFEDGTKEYVLENDKNVITYDSRRTHLQYLYDYTNAPQDELSTFKIGIGGAVGNDSQGNTNVRVIPPDPTRNDLFTPVAIPGNNNFTAITPSDPSANEVYLLVEFGLNQDEGNGFSFNECGLFKSSGNMFNHKTFASIEKSESFSLHFLWYLRYI